jgi:hypothetical protein
MNEEDEAFEDLAKRQGDWGMQGSRKHQILRYAENVESKGTSMTDKEAMKLALFALDIVKIHYTQSRHINEAITALKERLAQPEQEPTAKYSDIVSDGGLDPRNKFDAQVQRTEQEPVLYDTQFSEQERKEIAARGFVPFEFNRIVPPTQPPQRTWVGLTVEEIADCCRESTTTQFTFYTAIEAKLKEKNT